MKKFFSLSASLAVLIVSGCSFLPTPSNRPINYYDIGFPGKTYHTGANLVINPLTGRAGQELRMVFRDSSNRIKFDTFNRWSCSPNELVRRFLQLALKDKSDSTPDLAVRGEIIRFDGSLNKKCVNLVIKFTLTPPSDNDNILSQKIYKTTVPVTEIKATAYAEAMSSAMNTITGKLAEDIKQLQKKSDTKSIKK